MSNADWLDYQHLVEKHIQALNQIDLTKEEGYLARFAVFSANLTNFFPSIPVASHTDLFRQNLTHIALETLDRSIPNLIKFTTFEGCSSEVSDNKKQFIFCTFHLGSYRSMASWLVALGYDFSVLVRQSVYVQQSEDILDHAHQIKTVYTSSNSEVHVIDAEEPASALKILRELRTGRSLVVYMDGNTGSGHGKDERIDFLQRQIFTKQGAAFLSYASGIPILPVICYRQADHRNVIAVSPPIFPDKELSKKSFSLLTTQQLYKWFSTYLQAYPAQWEAWNYIHHHLFLPPESTTHLPKTAFQKSHYQFNDQRYSLFSLRQDYVIIDRFYYQTYEISDDLYAYLLQGHLTSPLKTLGKNVFESLVTLSVLI